GDPLEDDYKELVVRWFEYATFCPVLRLHGYRMPYIPADENAKGGGQCYTGGDNEIWSYGEDNFEIMKNHIFLRERMKPYITKIMEEAHKKGTPPMRPLFYDYPNDNVWDIDDQFMFGDSLLVCPIMELGKRQRQVYFPQGEIWLDAYTGKEYSGGQIISANAPIEHIPVYVRKNGNINIEIFKNN
ncbi:MAG: family 31 glucosidase, partial [Clostridia bacterium]|nr:family 31 glucosidase [Clostridia bacterium]